MHVTYNIKIYKCASDLPIVDKIRDARRNNFEMTVREKKKKIFCKSLLHDQWTTSSVSASYVRRWIICITPTYWGSQVQSQGGPIYSVLVKEAIWQTFHAVFQFSLATCYCPCMSSGVVKHAKIRSTRFPLLLQLSIKIDSDLREYFDSTPNVIFRVGDWEILNSW